VARQKNSINSPLRKLTELDEQFKVALPQLRSVLLDEEDFIGLNIKNKADGSTLAVVKRYDADGTPMVCFGVGYGFFGALYGANQAIQGNNWRVDKPWRPAAQQDAT
jgi:hypothetical protein